MKAPPVPQKTGPKINQEIRAAQVMLIDAEGQKQGVTEIADVFADRGRHARTTVGVSYLPLNALCEVEAMFELEY